jgi:hypothetical protein
MPDPRGLCQRWNWLSAAAAELDLKTHRPAPVRRVMIPAGLHHAHAAATDKTMQRVIEIVAIELVAADRVAADEGVENLVVEKPLNAGRARGRTGRGPDEQQIALSRPGRDGLG